MDLRTPTSSPPGVAISPQRVLPQRRVDGYYAPRENCYTLGTRAFCPIYGCARFRLRKVFTCVGNPEFTIGNRPGLAASPLPSPGVIPTTRHLR